ncbi:hypothetical protein [Bacillus amyloliquefaciens]|uniref:Uncharacterized protein n=1 Tax=Bacillus amyloliquefaciens TaxID=1390 RepID=A0AAP7N9U0_BACAM|nr:hypothetical protein [Bacillus amyloliquefaciens]OIK22653.1 hypothetical protein BKP66_03510 [Bacillus amyloliquefaciens]
MERTELWKLDKGWIAGYTEDKDLIRRVKRHKKDWKIIADYIKNGRLIGVHFKIPIEQRRPAERMFNTRLSNS